MLKIFVEKYNSLSDEELITKIRQNDDDAFETLFLRHLPRIKYLISKNNTGNNEVDDLLQDATISFYYAVQMFDFSSSSFPTFLSLCIERSLKSTIKKASAKKRIPNSMLVYLDDIKNHMKVNSAEDEFFDKDETVSKKQNIINKLSDLELSVLKSFLKTGSYELTADELSLSRKSVDNALFRIRRKLNS